MSLLKIYKVLGQEGKSKNILKVDFEGCMWRVLPKVFYLISQGFLTVDHIHMEVHGTNFSLVRTMFSAANEAGMRCFHKEWNHWGCNGYTFLDYNLIIKSFLREASYCKCFGEGNFSDINLSKSSL